MARAAPRGNTARTDAGLRAGDRTGLGDCQSKGWPRRQRGTGSPCQTMTPCQSDCLTQSPAPHQRRKWRSPALAPLPFPAGECRALPRQAIDTGIFRTRTAPTADFYLGTLSPNALQKMQKEVAGAFFTVLDWQMAKGCTKAEAIAMVWATSWPNWSGRIETACAPVSSDFRRPELLAPTWSGHGRKLRGFVDVAAID